eukprot:scaffold52186_cov29-Tisochrysis_lutea.AAC.15
MLTSVPTSYWCKRSLCRGSGLGMPTNGRLPMAARVVLALAPIARADRSQKRPARSRHSAGVALDKAALCDATQQRSDATRHISARAMAVSGDEARLAPCGLEAFRPSVNSRSASNVGLTASPLALEAHDLRRAITWAVAAATDAGI